MNQNKILLQENFYTFIDQRLLHKLMLYESDLINEAYYLTAGLPIEVYKRDTLEHNKRVFEISKQMKIVRLKEFPDFLDMEDICNYILQFQGEEIFEIYKNHIVTDTELDNLNDFFLYNDDCENAPTIDILPNFDLMIEYFARQFHLNNNLNIIGLFEKGDKSFFEENINKRSKQLKTNLSDAERGKLYDLLVMNEFIPDKDKEGFIWAFGGLNDNYSSCSIEWLKKFNLAVYLIDCLCFDANVKIQENYLNKMGKMFGVKNPLQIRNGYKNNDIGKPNGYELIDEIILEAQK